LRVAIDGILLSGNRPFSGVHRCIQGLARGLSALDTPHQFEFFVNRHVDATELENEHFRARTTRSSNHFRLRRILWDQFILPIRLRMAKVDVFHAPAYVMPMLTQVPTVLTVYDLFAIRYPVLCRLSNVLHFRKMLPRSVRRARRVIVPSLGTKDHLVETLHAPPERIRVIHPGVDPRFRPLGEDARQQVRDKYHLPEKFLLYVGNLDPKKNIKQIIRAFFASRAAKHYQHKLLIAGHRSWQYKELVRLAHELQVDSDVIFPGYFPDEDLPGLYNCADVFVFPSRIEGFGLPPLEAMACGTPVVTSRDPALVEATADGALHVRASDLAALRRTIEKLVTDRPLRREMRQKAIARARQFTWQKAAEKTVKVYEEVYEETQKAAKAGEGRPLQ